MNHVLVRRIASAAAAITLAACASTPPPQWQIDALKTFRMPQHLKDDFGYPDITDDMKAQIFGLNASRLYKLDPEEVRCTLPNDQLAQARAMDLDDHPLPSLRTYGPKTRREFLNLAFGGRPDPRRRG